jgi:anti-sigma factor RsiW
MSCGEERELLLQAYVDGELDVVRTVEMERHVAECAECAAALESHRALRAALGDPALYFEPPVFLDARVRAALGTGPKAAKAPGTRPWRWLAVAASLPLVAILAWAIAAVPRGPSDNDRVNEELVAAHVRSLMADHLTDVTSSNQHSVKPWFAGRLDFSPDVRDLASQGFPLVGGRLDYIDRRPVAGLVYRRRNHTVNVFVWPDTHGTGDRQEETSLRGYNVIRWRRSGTSGAAVSDLNLVELRELVGDLTR